MYKKNKAHQQPALISAVRDLPDKQRERLAQSWAGTFYREFFCRIDEDIFSVLYSDQPSRPNMPVNVLVGLEAIKAGFGWSDEEVYDAFVYNLQVRYALGYDRLGEGAFELRTLYYFRQRLSDYNLKHGVNLLEKAFAQITDQQIVELKIRTGVQRMDSTQIASNILDASRLHLVVEAVQRLHRILSPADQQHWHAAFAPYLKDSAGHYAYRVKGPAATQDHLEKVGHALATLLTALQPTYATDPVYAVVERLLNENFHLTPAGAQPKANAELSASSLQSLDDLEATYRTKGSGHYKGYVANVTETCDPQNPLQLITHVQVESNTVEDAQLLNDALPNLKARTDLETLITDGAYPSPTNDEALRLQEVRLIQTGIRGKTPDPTRFHLSDFEIDLDPSGTPTRVICPGGQAAAITPGHSSGWFARFPAETCATCPFQQNHRCRARPQQRDPRYFIDFTLPEARVAARRKDYLAQKHADHNLRAAVESTVRSLKHPFPSGKLPVRGRFRMRCLMIASASLVNIRRIWRYQIEQTTKETSDTAPVFSCLIAFCQNLVAQLFSAGPRLALG